MTYTPRTLADGRAIVLAPDGLTWEGEPFADHAQAARYAARLDEWAASRPLPDDLVPLLAHGRDIRPRGFVGADELAQRCSLGRLYELIDRLHDPERRLDGLSRAVRRAAAA